MAVEAGIVGDDRTYILKIFAIAAPVCHVIPAKPGLDFFGLLQMNCGDHLSIDGPVHIHSRYQNAGD